jgi:hypothetical protein
VTFLAKVMASDKFPTRRIFIKDGPKSIKGYDFDSFPPSPGDGRVPVTHAIPARTPSPCSLSFSFSLILQIIGIPHEFVRADLNHESILNDDRIPDLLQKMVDRVLEEGGSDALMNPLHPRL